MKKLLPLIAVSALAASTSAFAGEWYVAGSVGSSQFDTGSKTQLDNALVAAGATGLSSNVKKDDTGYKFEVGYQINQNFAVEGGYVDLGKAKYSATYVGGAASAQVKASGWNVDAVGIIPMGQNFSLFGKVGLIDAKVEISANATGPGGTASGSASSTDWKTTWGLGASYAINKNLAIRGEYDHFDKLGNNNKTGEGDVELWSVGLVYKF